jgi:hypothetical protein
MLSDVLWHVRATLRRIHGVFSVFAHLDNNGTDWTIAKLDWPRTWWTGEYYKPFPDKNGHRFRKYVPVRAHYVCRVYMFFERSSGVGRTPQEAARRAVAHMDRVNRRWRESEEGKRAAAQAWKEGRSRTYIGGVRIRSPTIERPRMDTAAGFKPATLDLEGPCSFSELRGDGSLGRTRTYNFRINSAALYH